MTCPDGFEVRDKITLCRCTKTSIGCCSVIYLSNGMSYLQLCGTVRVYPEGTQDGFNALDITSEVYVDGVNLIYGNCFNKNHIWIYTAAIKFGSNTRICDQCNYRKPSFQGTNFTCTIAHCDNGENCYPESPWGNEAQQCFGNETFYRQLSESTTNNIEMRVCRDQGCYD